MDGISTPAAEGFTTANIGTRLAAELPFYAALCGRALARAHARAGDAAAPSGYMGDDAEFDKAIIEFAMASADQTERDWHALLDAIKGGRLTAGEQHLPDTARAPELTRHRPRSDPGTVTPPGSE